MEKKSLSLFWKTFWLILGMLTTLTALICLFIYLLLPVFYRSRLTDHYENLVGIYQQALEGAASVNEEANLVFEMLQDRPAAFSIYNEEGLELFSHSQQNPVHSIRFTQGPPMDPPPESPGFIEEELLERRIEWMDQRENVTLYSIDPIQTKPVSSLLTLDFQYITPHGNRVLRVHVPIQPLSEAREVIIHIFPIVGVMAGIFALLIAVIYSRWFVVPIKNIQTSAQKMARIEPDVIIPIKHFDEIGELSHDLNQLYGQLRQTIQQLETENNRFTNLENKKLDFLQTVSHEMKTPLAVAHSLIEGIIYEVEPYYGNQKKYLLECHDFLERAISLTKESLHLSQDYKEPESTFDLHRVLCETFNIYELILKSKQITYQIEIPDKPQITTNYSLFQKALSNILSNAANHTPSGGSISITYHQECLIVENTCRPLSQSQIIHMFEPLVSSPDHKDGTGLGLYIVKQLLLQLNIPYSFQTSPSEDSLSFKLELASLL